MIPFQALIAAEHLADLQREAAAVRLANDARRSARDSVDATPRSSRVDVRHALARVAVRLSLAADGAARRLDPPAEPSEAFRTRRAPGVAAR